MGSRRGAGGMAGQTGSFSRALSGGIQGLCKKNGGNVGVGELVDQKKNQSAHERITAKISAQKRWSKGWSRTVGGLKLCKQKKKGLKEKGCIQDCHVPGMEIS